jgi:hypothetical protein
MFHMPVFIDKSASGCNRFPRIGRFCGLSFALCARSKKNAGQGAEKVEKPAPDGYI